MVYLPRAVARSTIWNAAAIIRPAGPRAGKARTPCSALRPIMDRLQWIVDSGDDTSQPDDAQSATDGTRETAMRFLLRPSRDLRILTPHRSPTSTNASI
jgi:hypothetical protein